MSERPTPETDAAEAKRRAEWLHKHKAHKDWIILSVSEIAVIRGEREQLERERDEARELLVSEKITRNHIIKRSVEVEKERDEARAVANAMADIAFKHLTSLLASTPHSKDAAHEEETQEVIAEIKRWKELKR